MKFFTACLATLLAWVSMVQAVPTHQFDHFFPGWNNFVQAVLRNNCSEPYAAYLTGEVDYSLGKLSLVNPVITCVLEAFPEHRKAELATGALVLGLIPTILQSIGSSTAEAALVGLRRPVLGFLIAAGSPTVSMMKTNDFASAISDFVDSGRAANAVDVDVIGIGSLRWSQRRALWALLIAALEYALVAGAVANVLHLAWELGVHAIAIFAPDTIVGVPLWTLGAALIYVAGYGAVRLRVRMRRVVDERRERNYHDAERMNPLNTGWLPTQLLPAVFQPAVMMELRRNGSAGFWFYTLTWIISIGTLAQVAFGTLVLSGLLFFSLVDCLIIVGRYTISAIACRAVVRLELAGMAAAMVPAHGKSTTEVVEPERVVLTNWKGGPQGYTY